MSEEEQLQAAMILSRVAADEDVPSPLSPP